MKSAFGRCHPVTNMIYFIAVIVFSMLMNHPVFIAISLFSALANAVMLKGKSILKLFFGAMLPLLLFVTAINSLFAHYGVTVLHTFGNGNSITLEAIVYGAVTGALVVTMLLWFVSYNETVTEDKFMHIFGRFMPRTALLTVMVLRFVPLYSKQLAETIRARKAAGIQEDGKKIKASASAVSGVITRALEHSIETADSMKARGYGLKGKTSYSRFVFSPADSVICFFVLLASAVTVAMMLTGTAEAIYNPIIGFSEITPLLLAFAIVYALLCLMPVIYNFEEEIRWNRLYAKL